MSTLRLEIVTGRTGLEPFVWRFFPDLTPIARSEGYVIYGCKASSPYTETQQGLLQNWVEEEIIVAYTIEESDQPVVFLYLTPVEAEALSGYSEEYWRQQAWKGNLLGAIRPGKQWLIPRPLVEARKKSEEKG